jgi:hypothetical protein
MNDIERYDFWHREQDAFLKKIHEDKLRVIDSSLVNLKFSNDIFDFVMGIDERIAARNKKES